MRYLILTIMTMSMVFASNAQLKMKRTGFGIHAGVNTNQIWYVENNLVKISPDHDPMPGYQIGMRYNLKLGPIGFCPEINYTSITTGRETTAFGVTENISSTLNYVSVPLLVKFYIGGFNVHFGGQVSTLLGGKTDTEITGGGTDLSVSYDLQDEMFYETINGTRYWWFQEIDLAAVVGWGIDTKRGLYMSCRSVVSLVPTNNILYENAILNELGLPDLEGEEIAKMNKWWSVQVSIGYNF